MAFLLTKVQAYGIEAEEAVNKRYTQRMILTITAANSDVDLDLGDYTGTFWNAVDATATGLTGLAAIKAINLAAESFIGVAGTSIAGKVQARTSIPSVLALDSAATSGTTGATRTLAVTGLLTTDSILGYTTVEDGATPAYVQEAAKTCAVADQYIVTFSADPGAGLEGRVLVSRAVTAVQAGTYQLVMNSTNAQLPDILFLSGEAPTAYVLVLDWVLKAGEQPVEVYAAA